MHFRELRDGERGVGLVMDADSPGHWPDRTVGDRFPGHGGRIRTVSAAPGESVAYSVWSLSDLPLLSAAELAGIL